MLRRGFRFFDDTSHSTDNLLFLDQAALDFEFLVAAHYEEIVKYLQIFLEKLVFDARLTQLFVNLTHQVDEPFGERYELWFQQICVVILVFDHNLSGLFQALHKLAGKNLAMQGHDAKFLEVVENSPVPSRDADIDSLQGFFNAA